MDFPDLVAKYGMKITGVLACGAHLAEEAALYDAATDGEVLWVEANPAVIPEIESVLAAYPRQRVVEALLWSHDGETKTFHRSNYDGMSSSVLSFGLLHTQFSPDTVFVDDLELVTTTIDTLVKRHQVDANLLVMDLQGCEGWALRGATGFLPSVDYVLSEVNCADVYEGCTRIEQMDALLADFERVETHWVGTQKWGDSLWCRR